MIEAEQQGFKPNNGSDPCMPVQGIREGDESLKLYGQLFHGLTKREHFAAMAMQGMLSNTHAVENLSQNDMAMESVSMAGALLKELEEQS